METPLKKSMGILWSGLRTGAIVALITLMIWFVADRNVNESENFTFPVRLQSASPDRYVAFADPPFQRSITVEMQGLRSRIRDFQAIVDEQRAFIVELDEAKPVSPEPQTISAIEDVLRRIKEIRDSRLSISPPKPDSFLVRIDAYETVKSIRVKPDFGQLKVNAELSFEEVSLKLPRFMARRMGQNPVARAPAETAVRAAAADGTFEVRVPLILDLGSEIDPNLKLDWSPDNQVTIRGRIEALTEVQTKGPVQITWSVPDSVQKQFVILAQDPDMRVYIEIQGPRSRLDQLNPADIRGLVEVFAGDMDDPGPEQEITRKVKFFLPSEFPDCSLTPQSQQFEVKFRLEKRLPAKNGELPLQATP